MPQSPAFHGEFSSSDASALSEANSRITLYGAGSVTPLTLAANQTVVVTSVQVTVGASALTVQVYDGSDATPDAGEHIVHYESPANGGIALPLTPGHDCQAGTYPKVKTSGAGNVKAIIHGYIR